MNILRHRIRNRVFLLDESLARLVVVNGSMLPARLWPARIRELIAEWVKIRDRKRKKR